MSSKPRSTKRPSTGKELRDRLHEAESTLAAIRNGEVDALVVSGPLGEQTVILEGATHPYFVLLNAMSDGAVLLDANGAILFGNRSFGVIAGSQVDTLRGSRFQRLLSSAESSTFEAFLLEGARQQVSGEFALQIPGGVKTPVAIALSRLPLGTNPAPAQPGGGAVLMGIVTDLTYRKAAEATRTTLLERLISAEDDERRRIARELHDETGQSLTALLVGLRAIVDMSVSPEARPMVQRLRDIAARTVDEVGRLARGLHPAVLDDMGLAAAGLRFVNDYAKSFGTTVDFTANDVDSPRLPPLPAATMYRILQEALTNVARHAFASNVVVDLSRDDCALDLVVRDDGVGFDASVRTGVSRMGLNGIRERVTLLGGSLQIESRPGEGTVVRARLPAGRVPPSPPPRSQPPPPARGQIMRKGIRERD